MRSILDTLRSMSLQLLQDPLKLGPRKLLCLEVNPPRGVDLRPIFERLDGKLTGIDFLNVTDCALAKMRLAALPFAAILKDRYKLETLVNVSCRDRNLIALQADLLAAWAQGVRSIVALTGDAVTIGDSPDRKGVFEVNSIGLLHAVAALNGGKDLASHELHGHPSFVSGVVVNPNARNRSAEIKRLKKKRDAGGSYALSQPVFDKTIACEFLQEAREAGVPLMLGLLPFKNAQAAHAMNNIPGIKFPDPLLAEIAKYGENDLSDLALEHCLSIAEATAPFVAGFHVVSGATPKLALRLSSALVKAFGKKT